MWALVHTSEDVTPESIEAWHNASAGMANLTLIGIFVFMLLVGLLFLLPVEEKKPKVSIPEKAKSTLIVANGHWVIVPPDSAYCEVNGVWMMVAEADTALCR
jgi:hypothetical protein